MLPLSACYVPDNFGAEIRITRDGNYGISYSGDLTWAPLYGQIARGEIDQDSAAEQIAGFTADLKQDSNFTFVASRGQGKFQVQYDRCDTFTRNQVVSFIRRNARIFQIQATENGEVRFTGRGASALQAQQLEDIGLAHPGPVARGHGCPGVRPQRHERTPGAYPRICHVRLAHDVVPPTGTTADPTGQLRIAYITGGVTRSYTYVSSANART